MAPYTGLVPSSQASDVGPQVPLPPRVRLFSLIIGIDNYDHSGCPKLRGAVADANALKAYLEEILRVPMDHIRTLFDAEATRNAIIGAFEDLQVDKRIHHGDPIVIFYAGHGGELPPPQAWQGVEGNIQCLFSRDYKPSVVHPIPDRTIGVLIENIAKAKGNNITVIFDCCHSASGTREENMEPGCVPRRVIVDHGIPADIDGQILGGRASTASQGLTYYGLRSHVLLAACGKKELAWERNGRGAFTTALLRILKESTVTDLTYAELLKRIELPQYESLAYIMVVLLTSSRQHPQCEVIHQHRRLFNAEIPAGRQVRHSVRAIGEFRYAISAGLAHGVSPGVQLTVYGNGKQRMNIIEVDDTAEVKDFQTMVTTSVHFADDSFAKLTRVGEVPFYLAQGETLLPSLKNTLLGTKRDCTGVSTFRFVDRVDEAKLEVMVDGELAGFNILDQRIKELGLTNLLWTVGLDDLAYVLSAAAHYYWYLDLANKKNREKQAVTVDFYPLEVDYDDFGHPLFLPSGPALRQPDSELDIISIVVTPQPVYYGIKITNHTPWDLYLNAFLFNHSNLSIDAYYTQPSTGNPEAPLRQGGTFTLGYGPGGTAPFEYSLDKDQNIDVSSLKVFFAVRPIDLSEVVQVSPFGDPSERDKIQDGARKVKFGVARVTEAPSEPVDMWFTIDIPVVQRRQEVTTTL